MNYRFIIDLKIQEINGWIKIFVLKNCYEDIEYLEYDVNNHLN